MPAICDMLTTGCLFNPDMFFTGEFLSLSTSESENCTMTGVMIGAPGMGTNVCDTGGCRPCPNIGGGILVSGSWDSDTIGWFCKGGGTVGTPGSRGFEC